MGQLKKEVYHRDSQWASRRKKCTIGRVIEPEEDGTVPQGGPVGQ